MKRIRFPKLYDIIVVDDASRIRAIAEDARVDRVFERKPLLNGLILGRRLSVLSYKGRRFPHQQPRGNALRASRQEALWKLYNDNAPEIAQGPEVLDALARWVKGQRQERQPGVLVQQVLGGFFSKAYRATPESYAAAVTVRDASGLRNLLKMVWWGITGKVRRAKNLLGSLANDDLYCMHATTVAIHNIVAGVVKMRSFYADERMRRSLTPEKAADLCLSPPPAVYRQATASGEAGGCPFSRYSLFRLELGKADSRHEANDLVFMTGSWSRCPADQWVPALLAGIWRRAWCCRGYG